MRHYGVIKISQSREFVVMSICLTFFVGFKFLSYIIVSIMDGLTDSKSANNLYVACQDNFDVEGRSMPILLLTEMSILNV
jgi:hypothetical protein